MMLSWLDYLEVNIEVKPSRCVIFNIDFIRQHKEILSPPDSLSVFISFLPRLSIKATAETWEDDNYIAVLLYSLCTQNITDRTLKLMSQSMQLQVDCVWSQILTELKEKVISEQKNKSERWGNKKNSLQLTALSFLKL